MCPSLPVCEGIGLNVNDPVVLATFRQCTISKPWRHLAIGDGLLLFHFDVGELSVSANER